MNIVFVNRNSFSYLGGVELHILNLAKELARNGHTLTLVCKEDAKSSGWVPDSEHVRVVTVAGLIGLYNFLRRNANAIDVCHAHLARSTFACFAIFFAWFLQIPTVFTPHCFYPSSSQAKRMLKWLYDCTVTRLTFRTCGSVINLTLQDQQDSANRGMPLEKSRIIPNSISVTKFLSTPPVALRDGVTLSPYLLHVGRFHPTKCVEFLVNSLTSLENLNLVLIGQDDGSLPNVRDLVRNLGLEQRVFVIQNVEFERLCFAYQHALALVIASVNEGLPTVMLEAALFGVPTIAPKVGGIPFVIEDGVSGYLYEWGDKHGYLRCVHGVLREGRKVGSIARCAVVEQFSWETNAQKIARVYSELSRRSDIPEAVLAK